MATKGIKFRFVVDAFTPDTLPMARLAEYLADLASLLGEKPNVHFLEVESGSAAAVYSVDSVALPKIEYRLRRVKSDSAEPEAARAYGKLNERLASDNAVGKIENVASGAQVLKFPGREANKKGEAGPIYQSEEMDGELIGVGGETDYVNVHLRTHSGAQKNFKTKKPIAKAMAQYLFGPMLRVQGKAKWFRHSGGEWQLLEFTIDSFRPLKDASLSAVAEDLRKIESGIASIDDPEEALRRIRYGDDTGR